MAFNTSIRFRVTALQYEILKNKAQVAGYKTVSAFVRDTALNVDFSMEQLVKEIHEIIVK
jgi:uncharacterized protein (DUF1778 family)